MRPSGARKVGHRLPGQEPRQLLRHRYRPCKTACPAHIAVQGYLKLAAQGKYREALQLIKRENPFPAVCGRICNRRCEDACTRGTVDQAVAIDEVKRFIAQQDLDAATRFVPEKVIPKVDGEFDQQIAIIGGGPAGLSCAYYLAEKGYRPTVFEKSAAWAVCWKTACPASGWRRTWSGGDRRAAGNGRPVPLRRGGGQGRDHCPAAGAGLSGLLCGRGPAVRRQAEHPRRRRPGCHGGHRLHAPGQRRPGRRSWKAGWWSSAAATSPPTWPDGGACGAESVDLYCLESYDDMPMGPEDRGECEAGRHHHPRRMGPDGDRHRKRPCRRDPLPQVPAGEERPGPLRPGV